MQDKEVILRLKEILDMSRSEAAYMELIYDIKDLIKELERSSSNG